jgi:hypothetical protein
MGSGSYSVNSFTGEYDFNVRSERLKKSGIDYDKMSINETFSQDQIIEEMSPYGVKIRESRDSIEHPNTLSIIIGLDVTGSMGKIPHYLIKNGLPNLMGNIIQRGIKDPQILFVAIGDHECDNAPLQISQFESSDELLDKWLSNTFLEGGGGCNGGESYLLAWFFAAFHTSIDCLEKRNQKGFLFTIGDEPMLKNISKQSINKIMGPGQYNDFSAFELLDKAKEKYNVFHLHVVEGSSGRFMHVIDGWKEIIGDNLIIVEDTRDIPKIISEIIIKNNQVTNDNNKINDNNYEKNDEFIL